MLVHIYIKLASYYTQSSNTDIYIHKCDSAGPGTHTLPRLAEQSYNAVLTVSSHYLTIVHESP